MNENTRIKLSNFALMLLIIAACIVLSAIVFAVVNSSYEITGFAWLAALFVWAAANAAASYMENTHREEGFVIAFLKSVLELVLIMISGAVLGFFLDYKPGTGIPIIALFTFLKLVHFTHPLFNKMAHSYEEIRELERTGLWVSDAVLGMESKSAVRPESALPPDAVEIPVETVVKPSASAKRNPPPIKPLKIKLPPPKAEMLSKDMLKTQEEKDQTPSEKSKQEAGVKHKNSVELFKKSEEKSLTADLMRLLNLEQGEVPPHEFDELMTRVKYQLSRKEKEPFEIPSNLSQKGLDEVPPANKNEIWQPMENRKRIQILLLSIMKDLSEIFNMKMKSEIDITVTFPWEMDEKEKRQKKLTDKMKAGDKWIISVTGALLEDITFAILTANLADIWFDENAHPSLSHYKTGFHFWIAYKMLKRWDYLNAAHQSTKQNPKKFNQIRNIEEKYGEYGVFYFITHNALPLYAEKKPAEELSEHDSIEPAKAATQEEKAADTADSVEPAVKPTLSSEAEVKITKRKKRQKSREDVKEIPLPAKEELKKDSSEITRLQMAVPYLPQIDHQPPQPVEIQRKPADIVITIKPSEPAEKKETIKPGKVPSAEIKKIERIVFKPGNKITKQEEEKDKITPEAKQKTVPPHLSLKNDRVLSLETDKTEKKPAEKSGKTPDIFRKAKSIVPEGAPPSTSDKKKEVKRLEIDIGGTRLFRGFPEESQFIKKSERIISLETGEIQSHKTKENKDQQSSE